MYKFTIKIDNKKLSKIVRVQLELKLDQALNDIADFVGSESDKILREGENGGFGSVDTGFLANSLVVDKDEWLHKEVGYGAEYAPYVEYSTSPHFPPLDVIYSWCYRKRKDLNIKASKKITKLNGKVYNADILKVAWAIATNMSKYGTEAKPFLRPAFYKGENKLKEVLKEKMK